MIRPLAPRLALVLCAATLGLSAAPAVADPLQPGKPSMATTNRASLLPTLSFVPRLVARADAMAAEGHAAPRPADGTAPDEADYIDYYMGLNDPGVIQNALDVATTKAIYADTAWGWLTLAEIALDIGMGDHDENGNAIQRPDAFAREALHDIAAGASVNGFVLARTAGEAVSALALMVRSLEDGGDAPAAARVAEMTKRFFPDPEATGYDTDMSALLRLIDNPPALPIVPGEDAPSPSFRNGDWVMTCGTARDCLIQSDLPNLSVEIARAAGPGAPVSVTFVLAGKAWGNANANAALPPTNARITVDAHPLYPEAETPAFRRAPAAMDGWDWFSVPPVRLRAAIDALLGGEKLTLVGAADRADISLYPLRALAEQMDRLQGREGTETALILRGDKPGSAVPPGPKARVFAVPVYERPWPNAPIEMSKRGQMTWRTQCQGATETVFDAVEIAGGQKIHLLACSDGQTPEKRAAFLSKANLTYGFSTSQGTLLTWAEANLFPASHAGVGDYGDGPAPLGLAGLLGQPDAPCPAGETYLWTGERLALADTWGLTDCKAALRAPSLIRALIQEIAK